MLKQSEIVTLFEKSGAYLTGHFLLTSGLHSPNYFQCAKVLQYPKNMTLLCMDIARKAETLRPEVILGPAIGGIVVAQEVGRILNLRTIFSERENNEMTLRRGFELSKGERVFIVEDVFTTGKSIHEVRRLVAAAGAELIGAAVIVDRSGGRVDTGVAVDSLLTLEVVTHPPEDCPLCRQGLPLVKPGSRDQKKGQSK
ncbi:MAG: orotate phosphoribosyltransferase [Fibrobacterota bacterium]